MITYPRTDSRYLSDDMVGKIKQTLGRLKDVPEFLPMRRKFWQKKNCPCQNVSLTTAK